MPTSLHVLIVEDERDAGDLLANIIEAEGHTAVTCRSGVEALQKVQNAHQPFDLVITDHYMPGSYTGVSLARVIRAKRLDIEILVISGQMTPELKEEYTPYAPVGFLSKPLDIDDLHAFLQVLVMA